jgi:RNA polymerase sigma-70 factor (ECF subfamily)
MSERAVMSSIPRQVAGFMPRTGDQALVQPQDAAARQAEFDALVKRQTRFVFRIAYALLRNGHDAEEVVQETFLKLYRAGTWESIRDERAFLARVAWRVAVDRRPKAKTDEPSERSASAIARSLKTELSSGGASPEEAVIAEDWNAVVHRLIDALPEDLRQPLVLSAIEEMNSREIAETMGIAEGTVRTRIMRARQMLKQRLASVMGDKYAK